MPENKSTTLNVLVVDDEEVVREMLKDVLTAAGYNVWTASNGLEAIERMKDVEFSIVITDIRMPGMDGVQVTQKFKEVNSDTTVIAITGYASIESAMAILKEGAYDYITKPFNIDEIKIIVGRAAERQRLLKEAKEKEIYKKLAILDGLTQVYNRLYFNQTLPLEIDRARRYGHPLAFLMIDIDNFKRFNDTQGHLAGDWALRKIAQIISGGVRISDLVFRYGGEEFAVVLPEANKMGAVTVATRIKRDVALSRFLDSKVMPTQHLTISIGVSTYPVDARNFQQIIEKADKCLYAAKNLGRDRICFLSEGKEVEASEV